LIRFQTINPPADYSEIAPYLYELLTSLGLETHIMGASRFEKCLLGFGEEVPRKKIFS
jgi:acetylornithine deacetylase/succinyl-diaminopimelate desuccinylase-like protein